MLGYRRAEHDIWEGAFEKRILGTTESRGERGGKKKVRGKLCEKKLLDIDKWKGISERRLA